jgi:hypothetical protein
VPRTAAAGWDASGSSVTGESTPSKSKKKVVADAWAAVNAQASSMLGGWVGRGVCATSSDYPAEVTFHAGEICLDVARHPFLRTTALRS